MPAPTFPSTANLAEGTGTRSLPAVTTAAGDWLVVEIIAEANTVGESYPPTCTGLTLTNQTDAGTGPSTDVRVLQYTAPDATGASRTVTITPSSGTRNYRAQVTVVRGSQGPGTGKGTTLTGQTVTVTRQGSNSGMFMTVGDFSTTNVIAGATWTPGGTSQSVTDGTAADYAFGRWDDSGPAGTAAHGINVASMTLTTPSAAVLEMLGTAGGAAVLATPVQPGKTWRRRFRHQQIPKVPNATAATVSGDAALTGAGTLDAQATQNAAASATGAGTVSAQVTQASGATLTGASTLSAAATVTASGSASLTGAGTLSAAGTVIVPGSASLTGAGTLTASAGGTQNGTATLTGAGALTAQATQGTTAAPTGAGTLTAQVAQGTSATLTGAGTLSAQVTQRGSATLTGAGSLSASTTGTQSGTASLTGAGTLTAQVTQRTTATLTGAGTLSAAATVTVQGTASLAGAGTVAAQVTLRATAAASGAGTVTATAAAVVTATATLTAAGTTTAAGATGRAGTASLLGAGTLAATGTFVTATLTGAGTLTATATVVFVAVIPGQGATYVLTGGAGASTYPTGTGGGTGWLSSSATPSQPGTRSATRPLVP